MPPQRASAPRRRILDCPTCGREFSRAEHLERHLRSHTKEKPFQCTDCGRNYSRFDVLARHQRNANHCGPMPHLDGTHLPVNRPMMNVHFENSVEPVASEPSSPLNTDERNQNGLQSSQAANPSLPIADVSPFSYRGGVNDYGSASGPRVCQDTHFQSVAHLQNLWMPQNDLLDPSVISMSDLFLPWTVDEGIHASLFDPLPFEVPMNSDANGGELGAEILRTAQVKDIWFTRDTAISATENASTCTSAMPSPRLNATEVDSQHRSRLQTRLRIQSFEGSVPSTAFLNTCIRLYFSKAHPIFPIIHPATFRPSKSNAALTLAICAMGTLFMGSDRAVEIGMHLFNRLNKATLLYWEKAKTKNSNELVSIIQGAAIGQAFGLLSGNTHVLLTVDAFHGPPVAWARHQGLFNVQNNVNICEDLSEVELDQKWHEWSRNEEHVRTIHGLRIIDAELASLLHHEPIMKFNCRTLFPTCSNKLFKARTSKEWASGYFAERSRWATWQRDQLTTTSIYSLNIPNIPAASTFTAYAVLEELHMCAISAKSLEIGFEATMDVMHTQLSNFHRHFITSTERDQPDTHLLCVLWHSVYVSMFSDIDLLEKVIGREGPDTFPDRDVEVMRWAETYDCPRAAAHALMIKKHVEAMTVLDEPPIHLPQSLFHSGIVLFCYYKFASQRWKDQIPRLDVRYHELTLCGGGAGSVLREGREPVLDMPKFQRPLYVIVQLLQRIGSWRLSRRFAEILGTITVGELG